jgi:hypothetical protein
VTDCQGSWGFERELGETGVVLLTCSGCGELWALDGSRAVGTFPPGTADELIVRRALEAHVPKELLR